MRADSNSEAGWPEMNVRHRYMPMICPPDAQGNHRAHQVFFRPRRWISLKEGVSVSTPGIIISASMKTNRKFFSGKFMRANT